MTPTPTPAPTESAAEQVPDAGATASALRLPDPRPTAPVGAVLLCADLPDPGTVSAGAAIVEPEAAPAPDGVSSAVPVEPRVSQASLLEALADALVEAGLAVTSIAPLRADVVAGVEEIGAVLESIRRDDVVDAERVSLLGIGAGAAAACVASAAVLPARLILVTPLAVESTALRRGGRGEADESGERTLRALAEMSPIRQLVAHDRPALVVHGAADDVVSPEHAAQYVGALRSCGAPVRFTLVAFGDHGYQDDGARRTLVEEIVDFLEHAS